MSKWFIVLLIVILALFILFGINTISYNSNSLTFRLNSGVINDNIIVEGIIFIVFIIMVYIGYRIVVK